MIRTFSFGGGVQSTTALVLAAQGEPLLAGRTFLFANVGADSEKTETLDYVHQIAMPYAEANGIQLLELQRRPRRGRYKGRVETLYQRLVDDNRSIAIPARLSNGAPGNRACTVDFKIRVIAAWLKAHGATVDDPAITGIGFTMDEVERMKDSNRIAYQVLDYPLLDLHLSRSHCYPIIQDAGLPVPPKSACWFCPMQRIIEWQRLRSGNPELFARACALERRINEKRGAVGRDIVYLHRALRPLDEAVGLQLELDFDDECDSGYCFL